MDSVFLGLSIVGLGITAVGLISASKLDSLINTNGPIIEKMPFLNDSTPIPIECRSKLQEAMRNLEIDYHVSFCCTPLRSHAASKPFPMICLEPKYLVCFTHPWTVDLSGNSHRMRMQFWSAVYHELCHIKFHQMKFKEIHTNKLCSMLIDINSINIVIPPSRAKRIHLLYQEMEAELTAIYFLFRLFNHRQIISYISDDFHPTPEDMIRYEALLIERLKADPDLGYESVRTLAEEYLVEKEPWFRQWLAI